MTGLSGSGKTSLAFDTIYAEGQRRYVESLSAYARQFLGNMEKPNVEVIEGLSPSIAIDQKTTSNNPRSTVGTVTEIYDYLRLLYARVGVPICPNHHVEITSQSVKQIVDQIMAYEDGSRLEIMAPIVKRKKGEHVDLLADLRKEGYIRAYIDGDMVQLDEVTKLERTKNHDISVVVDRIVKKEDSQFRINDSVETALNLSGGILEVKTGTDVKVFSNKFACPYCGFSIPNIEPRLFSFNAPLGACHTCNGLGITQSVDLDLLIPDDSLSISEGGIRYYKNIVNTQNIEWQTFEHLCKHAGVDIDKPLNKLTKKQLNTILYGSQTPVQYTIHTCSGNMMRKNEIMEGIVQLIERRHRDTSSSHARDWYASFLSESTCKTCQGMRLNEQALSVHVGNVNLPTYTALAIDEAKTFIENLDLDPMKREIAALVIQEIDSRLQIGRAHV